MSAPHGHRSRIGDYEVLTQLSAGGMGEVLLARRHGAHGFEKLLAIKTIRTDLRERSDLRTMFLDEARLVARIAHPTITQVYDFGEDGDTLYIVMEYVAGQSFSELRKKGLLASCPGIAVRAVAEVCRGLHSAHELRDLDGAPLGVVHRDVSPENLVLTFSGHVKILDFGIALVRDRRTPQTLHGTIKGKPSYMAPEQLAGKPIDRRADVYSTGTVLYELLTGERLFAGASPFEVAWAIEHAEIVPPSRRSPSPLPEALDRLVMRSLARNAGERFEDALAMGSSLEVIADGMSVEPLETFAARALGTQREEHAAFLREVLDGPSEHAPAAGRGGDVPTVPLTSAPTVPGRPQPVAGTTAPAESARPGGRRLRVAAIVSAALIVVALGAAALWAPAPASPPAIQPVREAPAPPTVEPEPAAAATPAPEPVQPAHGQAKRIARLRPTRPRGSTKPPPQSPTTFGYLQVMAEPYAVVRVDGALLGPTPILRHRLPTGSHEVELLDPAQGVVRHKERVVLGEEQVVAVRLGR